MFTKEQGLKITMLDMTDFFQRQAQESRRLAAQASGKKRPGILVPISTALGMVSATECHR
jgi:hypothetical protein